MLFDETDPPRTATRHQRHFYFLIAFQVFPDPLQQFCPFFHNSQVGGKIRIENIIEAQPAEGGNHFTRYQCPRFISEIASQSRTDSRSCLGYHDFVRIGQRIQHRLLCIPSAQRVYWADRYALAALGTRTTGNIPFESRRDGCIKASIDSSQSPNGLDIITHGLATAAHDALVHVADDRR